VKNLRTGRKNTQGRVGKSRRTDSAIDEASRDFGPIEDPIDWIQLHRATQTRVELTARRGSLGEAVLDAAKAKARHARAEWPALVKAAWAKRLDGKDPEAGVDWLNADDAQDLLSMIAAPVKRGAPLKPETLWRIQGLAWLAVHEPGLRGRALAVRMGMKPNALQEFRKRRRSLLRAAVELLRPNQ
jgi:hypothetical protein